MRVYWCACGARLGELAPGTSHLCVTCGRPVDVTAKGTVRFPSFGAIGERRVRATAKRFGARVALAAAKAKAGS